MGVGDRESGRSRDSRGVRKASIAVRGRPRGEWLLAEWDLGCAVGDDLAAAFFPFGDDEVPLEEAEAAGFMVGRDDAARSARDGGTDSGSGD